jgi:acetyl esterase/lipase
MKACLVSSFLLAVTAASAHGLLPMPHPVAVDLVRTGLSDADNASGSTGVDPAKLCEQVLFSRNLRYGEAAPNVLDVATPVAKATYPRPVLLFVAGESFTGDGAAPDFSRELQDQAMCFAARNDMIGVRMSYRPAPSAQWPSGAKDVAAALSWIHQNIDLFNGNSREIVAIGYAAGAFHLATLLAHPEMQVDDSDAAGIVLVSGLYRPGPDASESEKAYLGADQTQYDKRSVLPGILMVAAPILLAWAADDTAQLIAQGEKLQEQLCAAGHCPRTTVLMNRGSLGAALLDGSSGGLAEPTLQLVRQLEARGLP